MEVKAKKLLLVEGASDKRFFDLLCKDKLELTVGILRPSESEEIKGDGKGNLVASLKMYMGEIRRAQYASIAAIVDADNVINDKKNGIEGTIQTFLEALNSAQDSEDGAYKVTRNGNSAVFSHNNGFIDFHLWVMTNENGEEGIFEDWLKTTLKDAETPLLEHAMKTVDALNEKRFKPIHKSKAEIATWRAWQKIPAGDVNIEQLNLSAPPMKHLIDWLEHIYR
jgi:hypothetical protein